MGSSPAAVSFGRTLLLERERLVVALSACDACANASVEAAAGASGSGHGWAGGAGFEELLGAPRPAVGSCP